MHESEYDLHVRPEGTFPAGRFVFQHSIGIPMARLKQMPSRLGVAPIRLVSAPKGEAERSRQRDAMTPWRGWYKLARWAGKPNGLRWRVLVRDRFTCQRCHAVTRDPNASDMVADHRIPHRGDERLFWDFNNLQCLCKACHDRHKQREERRGS